MWTLFFEQQPVSVNAPPPSISEVRDTIDAKHLTNFVGSGPVAIVEFTDFECPFCARHATVTLTALKKQLVDSGKARYFALNLPLKMHPHAEPAAEAAECAAEQGQFWRMHELLFARQKDLATTNFVDLAGELGLNLRQFEVCLDSDLALKRVRGHVEESQRLGVRSTPVFFLGRVRNDGSVDLLKRIEGARPFETFSTELAKMTRF